MPPRLDKDAPTERVQIVASASWLERIEEWRRAQARIPSLSAAIRHLIDLGLAAAEAEKGVARRGRRS